MPGKPLYLARALTLAIPLIAVGLTESATAHSDNGPNDEAAERLAEGGRLYDNWWAEYQLPAPDTTHPAYPSRGQRAGATTWRCKECHGWDYRGRDGAYATGSHYTGITGLERFDGGDPDRVYRILTSPIHGYDAVLPDSAIRRLSRFVVAGQIEMARHIDPASGKALGDPVFGKTLYADHCLRCHGVDGRRLEFGGDRANPEYLGTLANANPWETLHKIRNGHPASRMPMPHGMMGRWRPGEAMPHHLSIGEAAQAAILAYTQTLPTD